MGEIMFFKCLKTACLVATVLMNHLAFSAENLEEKMIGFWQKKGSVIVLEIVKTDGRLEGTIVRSDWEPGLVGKVFAKNLEVESKRKLKGELLDLKSNEYRPGSLSEKRGQTLSIRVKGRKPTLWMKSESKDHVR